MLCVFPFSEFGLEHRKNVLHSNILSGSAIREFGISCWNMFQFVTVKENDFNKNRHQR